MEAIGELINLVVVLTDEVKALKSETKELKAEVAELKKQVENQDFPFVRGRQGVANRLEMSLPNLYKNNEIMESLTPFKVSGKIVYYQKQEIDEFVGGTKIG